jgi:hypothetical protein
VGDVELLLYVLLSVVVVPTSIYHIFDFVNIFGIGKDNDLVSFSVKFRAAIECRPYYIETHDESCYSKYEVDTDNDIESAKIMKTLEEGY